MKRYGVFPIIGTGTYLAPYRPSAASMPNVNTSNEIPTVLVADSPGTRVYHNLITRGSYPNAIEYRFGSSKGIDIKNNLTDAAIQARDGATGTLAGNVTSPAISLFVNPTAGNPHLVRNASVINQGVPLSDVTTDIDGDSRDNTPNVGADE